eukprot:c17345_g1_i2.p1 GENE.c17345_g1_i2~~c17345_g1_i2.p1  ORF type:complete len:484 (-),score=91.69 c17345_g1_i2:750-1991(-)
MASMYETCTCLTMDTAMHRMSSSENHNREETFVATGDIPDMWLRDSSGQIRPYAALATADEALQDVLEGVMRLQQRFFLEDPYGNAFRPHFRAKTGLLGGNDVGGWVATRNYELDSVGCVISMLHHYWKATGRTGALGLHDKEFGFQAFIKGMLDQFETEQHHTQRSEYSHFSLPDKEAVNMGGGRTYTGMVWSGFRPSDDAQTYGYHIPDNMLAAVSLSQAAEILDKVFGDHELRDRALEMRSRIDKGIEEYGTTEHPKYGRIYAYESDGNGHFNLMDDANVPSLLAIPYLNYTSPLHDTKAIYANTRQFILSHDNPFFFTSSNGAVQGIGSPHTQDGCIWPMSILMRGLTATSKEEVEASLRMAMDTDADTLYMHESFRKNDPSDYTRGWFGWPNALFSELVDKYMKLEGI